jgi:hypothetical protein
MEPTEQELKELAAVEENADEDPKVENVNGL